MNKALRFLAQLASWLFHPLLMPVLGFFLFFQFPTYLQLIYSPQDRVSLLVLLASTTFLVPSLTTLLFVIIFRLNDLQLPDAKTRRLPLLATAIYYSVGYYLIKVKIPLPLPLQLYFLGALLAVVLNMLINRYYKISSHAIGVGGLFGGVLSFMYLFHIGQVGILVSCAFLMGIIATSRLYLQSHTPFQVYLGLLLGFLCEFLLFYMVPSFG